MEIEKLGGTTERLYRLVAPLVMKPCILRENNNYPFKTSMHHNLQKNASILHISYKEVLSIC